MGRGRDRGRRREYYAIEPRGPSEGIILQAWINPEALQKRSIRLSLHRKTPIQITRERAFEDLLAYCVQHLRKGKPPEIYQAIPPRPVDESIEQPVLYVRIHDDGEGLVRNRVECQMRRLGFHTAILHASHLPSEQGGKDHEDRRVSLEHLRLGRETVRQ